MLKYLPALGVAAALLLGTARAEPAATEQLSADVSANKPEPKKDRSTLNDAGWFIAGVAILIWLAKREEDKRKQKYRQEWERDVFRNRA
jgi:hypothetical protein